jgi:hypothetical protein
MIKQIQRATSERCCGYVIFVLHVYLSLYRHFVMLRNLPSLLFCDIFHPFGQFLCHLDVDNTSIFQINLRNLSRDRHFWVGLP